ncbi:MAG: aspartyl-tRNA synthetase, partial [Frankiaceae bacterium]|nr:aspartyl-tRNA synthetase [Frankiaceae bacterium]
RVVGEVSTRPEGNENPELPSGAIEVLVTSYDVLSTSEALPFPIDGHTDVGEERRLRYRYLDLRSAAGPGAALRTRSKVTNAARRVMERHDFLEIETPYLTRSTPEGARDFLVPVRLQPGSWYALPQSPQLFKQLLMVAGMERYYQFARCFRDEDFRADRQPEFTQLDVELSFCEQDDILALGEDLLSTIWREVLDVEIPTPFPRMTYDDAMRRYGSDKPDVRFGLELADLTALFAKTDFKVFQSEHVGAVLVPGGATDYTRKQFDAWQEWSKSRGGKGVAYVQVGADGIPAGGIAKFLREDELRGLVAATDAKPGDAVFFQSGPKRQTLEALGALRVAVAKDRGLIPEGRWEFLWVTDAPMFEATDDGGWTAVHHPFTRPRKADEAGLVDAPGEALAIAYDVVLNGSEIGGGSLRIHERDLQEKVFGVLGLSAEEAQSKFGFLLEAFKYGPPPHGGIAFGWDRILQHITGTESIRDVIAFPKTASGGDPLTGAPTPITTAQRREAGIDKQPASASSASSTGPTGAAPPNRPAAETRPDTERN